MKLYYKLYTPEFRQWFDTLISW